MIFFCIGSSVKKFSFVSDNQSLEYSVGTSQALYSNSLYVLFSIYKILCRMNVKL